MRKILMLVTMAVLTTSAGWSLGPNISTYCEGTCLSSGQQVVYTCGYGVSGPRCCSRARTNACPGDEFNGTCTETYGTLGC